MDPRPARPARRSLAALLAVSLAAACGQVSPPPSPAGTPEDGTPRTAGPAASSSSIPATAPVASSSSVPATGPDQSITPSPSGPDAAIDVVASGIVAPVGLVTPPDGSGRSFVLDQTGEILVLDAGRLLPRPFLDIRSRLVRLDASYDERGLLGLAFDPGFATNGRFFVYYSAPLRRGAEAGADHTDRLSEFHVSGDDPNRADPASERPILEFEQPQPNHNGGSLGFGPDGYLYLGVGDGGGEGDASAGHSPQGNAQDLGKLNGKILRIDVEHASDVGRYAIPADNPFVSVPGARPEIYAYGLRNPWRFSWEPSGERRLIVGDVGYGLYEEVDLVRSGGNYGWRIREGHHCLDLGQPLRPLPSCATTGARGDPLIEPVVEYSHRAVGIAVVGGYVYRGSALPALRGEYVFADFSADWQTPEPTGRGSLLVASPAANSGEPWQWRFLSLRDGDLDAFVTGMGEDADGELYVMVRDRLGPDGRTGRVLKLVGAGG